jgi:hypothetical protein
MIKPVVDKFMGDLNAANWCNYYHRIITADKNEDLIKASPSLVFGWSIFNNAAYPIFVKLVDASVVGGGGTLKVAKTIGVPAGGGSNIDLGAPIVFNKGLFLFATKLIADSDTTVLVAGDGSIDLHYR